MTEGFDYDKVGSWHGPVHRALSPAVRFMWDLQIDGLEHVPEDGPAILAPNHISFLDSSFLLFLLERQITFVGKAEYLDSRWRSVVYPRLGMIPVDRRGGDHAQAALDAARRVLESGGLFGIFPEGTRSRNGHLHKGRTGAARLSLETGAPIIPVGIIGTEKIMPPDARAPQLFRTCAIRFGRPVRPSATPSGVTIRWWPERSPMR